MESKHRVVKPSLVEKEVQDKQKWLPEREKIIPPDDLLTLNGFFGTRRSPQLEKETQQSKETKHSEEKSSASEHSTHEEFSLPPLPQTPPDSEDKEPSSSTPRPGDN